MDRVIWDSWHKFVYYDNDDKSNILDDLSKYRVKLNSNEPIVIYINDLGLPNVIDETKVDRYIIEFFHHRYYELLILLSIIDKLIRDIDIDVLNSRFRRLFHLLSDNVDINDVIELRDLLDKCINIYKNEYVNYIETGILGKFYNDLEISNVIIDMIVSCIKKSIGLEKYFSFVIDGDNIISKYSQMSINDYIASRCTGYLSINVLLSINNWKYYYSSNGQLIENIHDYSEIDLRKNKVRSIHL